MKYLKIMKILSIVFFLMAGMLTSEYGTNKASASDFSQSPLTEDIVFTYKDPATGNMVVIGEDGNTATFDYVSWTVGGNILPYRSGNHYSIIRDVWWDTATRKLAISYDYYTYTGFKAFATYNLGDTKVVDSMADLYQGTVSIAFKNGSFYKVSSKPSTVTGYSLWGLQRWTGSAWADYWYPPDTSNWQRYNGTSWDNGYPYAKVAEGDNYISVGMDYAGQPTDYGFKVDVSNGSTPSTKWNEYYKMGNIDGRYGYYSTSGMFVEFYDNNATYTSVPSNLWAYQMPSTDITELYYLNTGGVYTGLSKIVSKSFSFDAKTASYDKYGNLFIAGTGGKVISVAPSGTTFSDNSSYVAPNVGDAKTAAQNAESAAEAAQTAAQAAQDGTNTIINSYLSTTAGIIQDSSGNTALSVAKQASQNALLSNNQTIYTGGGADNNKSAAQLSKEGKDLSQQAVTGITNAQTQLSDKLDTLQSNFNNSITNIQNFMAPPLNRISGYLNTTVTSGSSINLTLDYSQANEYQYRIDNGSWSSWTSLASHDANGYLTVPGLTSGFHTIYIQIRYNNGTVVSPAAKGSITVQKL